MINKQHTYSLIYKLTRNLSVFMAFIFVVLGFLVTIVSITALVGGGEFKLSFMVSIFGNFLGFTVWSPIFYLFLAYFFADINVNIDGMEIRLLWQTYQIKWDEIIEVKPFRSFGLFTNKNWDVIFVKSKLTFFHRLYGIIYGGKNQPAILIYRKISDYDLLIKDISMCAKNNSVKPVINK